MTESTTPFPLRGQSNNPRLNQGPPAQHPPPPPPPPTQTRSISSAASAPHHPSLKSCQNVLDPERAACQPRGNPRHAKSPPQISRPAQTHQQSLLNTWPHNDTRACRTPATNGAPNTPARNNHRKTEHPQVSPANSTFNDKKPNRIVQDMTTKRKKKHSIFGIKKHIQQKSPTTTQPV